MIPYFNAIPQHPAVQTLSLSPSEWLLRNVNWPQTTCSTCACMHNTSILIYYPSNGAHWSTILDMVHMLDMDMRCLSLSFLDLLYSFFLLQSRTYEMKKLPKRREWTIFIFCHHLRNCSTAKTLLTASPGHMCRHAQAQITGCGRQSSMPVWHLVLSEGHSSKSHSHWLWNLYPNSCLLLLSKSRTQQKALLLVLLAASTKP